MKHVFKTNEVAHRWMHQDPSDGCNPQNNFFYTSDTIYSYGSHFPIARHIERKGKRAVLFTMRGYSNTTAQHICHVRRAIPDTVPVFYVPTLSAFESTKNADIKLADIRKTFDARVKDTRKALADAKSKPQTAKRYRELDKVLRDANAFNEWAGYKARHALPGIWPELDAIAREQQSKTRKRTEARRARQRQHNATLSEQARRKLAELQARLPELMDAWRNGKHVPELDGYYLHTYNAPVMLRVAGDEIETSLGARFPVAHAIAGLKFIQRVMASGQEYVTNGHTFHLGAYAIERVEVNGNVTAGCHYVEYAEIQRLAGTLGMSHLLRTAEAVKLDAVEDRQSNVASETAAADILRTIIQTQFEAEDTDPNSTPAGMKILMRAAYYLSHRSLSVADRFVLDNPGLTTSEYDADKVTA